MSRKQTAKKKKKKKKKKKENRWQTEKLESNWQFSLRTN